MLVPGGEEDLSPDVYQVVNDPGVAKAWIWIAHVDPQAPGLGGVEPGVDQWSNPHGAPTAVCLPGDHTLDKLDEDSMIRVKLLETVARNAGNDLEQLWIGHHSEKDQVQLVHLPLDALTHREGQISGAGCVAGVEHKNFLERLLQVMEKADYPLKRPAQNLLHAGMEACPPADHLGAAVSEKSSQQVEVDTPPLQHIEH